MEEVRPAPLRARFTVLQLAIVAVAAAFGVLAALVVSGRLSGLDQYALDHWMHGLDAKRADDKLPPLTGIFMPFAISDSWSQKLLDLATYPASILVSAVVFGLGGLVLWLRGSRTVAVACWATWFVANALEAGTKLALTKPALHREQGGVTYHVVPFDHSFPSGHTVRAVLLAAVIALVWRRYAWPAAVWALLVVPVCLVAASAHVPSDVAGGLLFGLLVVLVVAAALGPERLRQA
jgi:membrane-associated phospholipid phosphatase